MTACITTPCDILTSSPDDSFVPLSGSGLAKFFTISGVPAQCINITVAPQLVHYDLNLANILQYNEPKLKRILLAFSARYRCQADFAHSAIADFGVDVIRSERAPLYLEQGLCTNVFNDASRSSCVVGVDTTNYPVVIDIATAPHILIAGTTGSGKSVLLNSIICSLLLKISPSVGRLLLIDPKQVELSAYEGLPHLACPIVRNVQQCIQALSVLCNEIDRRYRYMASIGVKTIDQTDLPRIYCVIDELADLMLTSKKAVESYIVRIAQIGRAAGIHLIIATQRPTVNIITGLIKANIPTKIALAVSNTVDSVNILNHKGAEKLVGRGDAILKKPDSIYETRFQTLYTPDTDIQAIVDYYRF